MLLLRSLFLLLECLWAREIVQAAPQRAARCTETKSFKPGLYGSAVFPADRQSTISIPVDGWVANEVGSAMYAVL